MIEEIIPGLWRVGGRCWDGRQQSLSDEADANVYLLRADGAWALIDCGSSQGRPIIEQNVREAGVEPDDIEHLILSHSHFDHTHAAARWQRIHGLKTHLNAVGAEFMARGDHRLVGHQVCDPPYEFEPFTVDHAIADGETFQIGQTSVTATFVPGHTPDCTLLAFELDGKKVGIVGDVSFGRDAAGEYGCIGWLCMLWKSNLVQYSESLTKLRQAPLDVMISGHGMPVIGAEAVSEALTASQATVERLRAEPRLRHFAVAI